MSTAFIQNPLRAKRILATVAIGLAMLATASRQSSAMQFKKVDPTLYPQNDIRLKDGVNQAQREHADSKKGVLPKFAIPIAPLGFTTPASYYLGGRLAQVSLNFLDEDTLLFTFRVPELIARDHSSDAKPTGIERRIRAVVVALPSGQITAEALWTLHDYGRYLWTLKDHRFLLRDQNQIMEGDATLHLKPFLRFPGLIRTVEFDPEQKFLIANTREPLAAPADKKIGDSARPEIEQATATTPKDDARPTPETQGLLRIISVETQKVLFLTRVPGLPHLPVDGEGYYEALRGKGLSWIISYEDLHGGSIPFATIESACSPELEVLAPSLVLVSTCMDAGSRHYKAISRPAQIDANWAKSKDKHRLWELSDASNEVWPLIVRAANGPRFARALLEVDHQVNASNPIDGGDIRSQSIGVYDLATGKANLAVQATPILDGGGNFALSPSGNRFAVLNSGQLQVFELPPAPALPAP